MKIVIEYELAFDRYNEILVRIYVYRMKERRWSTFARDDLIESI